MAFNGSGVFNRIHNWVTDKSNAIKINASRMDAEFDGMATGLSTAITKDGQTTVTADLPMATFKHTGVGNAAARTDYASAGQVQDGAFAYAADGGAANAYAMTVAPAITAYAAGQTFRFKAANANTGASTLAVSGLATKVIQIRGGAISAGTISANDIVEVVYDGTQFQMISAAVGAAVHSVANLTTNPGMTVAQASADVTGIGGAAWNFGPVDEWGIFVSNTAGAWTLNYSTAGGVDGISPWLKALCTTGDATVGAVDGMSVFNLMEGYKVRALLAADGTIKAFVISFDIIVHLDAGSSETFPLGMSWPIKFADPSRNYCATFTVASGDTWERIDLIIPADATAATSPVTTAWNCRHGVGLFAGTSTDEVADTWTSGSSANNGVVGGPNLGDATNNYVGIANVDVFPGTAARPFVANSYDHDLAECQRYFRVFNYAALAPVAGARGESTTVCESVFSWDEMATTPSSVAVDDVTGFQCLESADPVVEVTGVAFSSISKIGCLIGWTTGGTLTVDGAIGIRADGFAHTLTVNARMV